jgi:hypothetical protein
LRKALLALLALAVAGAVVFHLLTMPPATVSASALPAHTPDLANGKYVFTAAGCAECHAVPVKKCDDLKTKDKETLAGYQVLVAPNAACLSAEEVETIRAFVRAGGGLVCTGETSRWNERGEPGGDYQLGDVFGISYVSDTGAYSKVYSRFEAGAPVARRLPADGYITSRGPLAQVELKGAEALARIVFPLAEPTADRFVNIMTNPPAVPSDWPACTEHAFGKGRAIYFAGGIDRDYVELSFPELKWVLCDAVRAAAAAPLKVELQAPASVELAAWEREGGKQLVVHLVNCQPEVGRELAHSRHVIEEIIPVHDLELTIRVDRPVRAVHLQPANLPLAFAQEGGAVTVQIERLDCHAMVVFDLSRPS